MSNKMSSRQATWTHLRTLAQQARQAGADRRRLGVSPSPDEGGAFDWLADEPDLYSNDDLQERFDLD